ncbi:LAC14, partial [Linum perenne]
MSSYLHKLANYVSFLHVLVVLLFYNFLQGQAAIRHHTFVVKEASYTRLCNTKSIMTINGNFPGETLYANRGDTVVVNVINKSSHNITIH